MTTDFYILLSVENGVEVLFLLNNNIGHEKQDWLRQRTDMKVTWNHACHEMDNAWSSSGFCDETGIQTCCLYITIKSESWSFALHHVVWSNWLLIKDVDFSLSWIWTKGHNHESSWKYSFLTTFRLYTAYISLLVRVVPIPEACTN